VIFNPDNLVIPSRRRDNFRRARTWCAQALLWALFPIAVRAQATLYWDTNGSTSGTGSSPSGTWAAGSGSVWSSNSSGKSATTTWTNGSDAVFSAGSSATGSYTVTVSGIVEVSSITVQEGSPTFAGGTIRFTDSTPDFSVGSGLTTTVGSTIADNWTGLNKTGAGTLVLTGANIYNGGTTISAGTLVAASDSALGAASWSNTVASGATLALQGGITLNQNALAVTGSGVGGNGALVNLGGDNTLTANTTFSGNTTVSSTAGTLTMSGTVALGSGATTVTGAGDVALTGAVQDSSSSASLTYAGTGTLTLAGSAANTFTGTFTVASGTVVAAKTGGVLATNGGAVNVGDGVGAAGSAVLRLDADQQLATYTSLLTIKSDGKLAINNVSQTIDKIAGTGLIDLATSGKLVVGAYSGSSTFAGTVTGTGTLEKTGSGTLTFSSSFNFDGTLTLSGGTLALSGVTLGVGTLHITANSILDFSGASASLLSATNLVIDAGVTLTITGWSDSVDAFVAQNWAGVVLGQSGTSATSQIVFTGYSANSTTWQNYDHQITPVPEPSLYGALLLGACTSLYLVRRRRNRLSGTA
jgi:autotransporter-associated beta strand protein